MSQTDNFSNHAPWYDRNYTKSMRFVGDAVDQSIFLYIWDASITTLKNSKIDNAPIRLSSRELQKQRGIGKNVVYQHLNNLQNINLISEIGSQTYVANVKYFISLSEAYERLENEHDMDLFVEAVRNRDESTLIKLGYEYLPDCTATEGPDMLAALCGQVSEALGEVVRTTFEREAVADAMSVMFPDLAGDVRLSSFLDDFFLTGSNPSNQFTILLSALVLFSKLGVEGEEKEKEENEKRKEAKEIKKKNIKKKKGLASLAPVLSFSLHEKERTKERMPLSDIWAFGPNAAFSYFFNNWELGIPIKPLTVSEQEEGMGETKPDENSQLETEESVTPETEEIEDEVDEKEEEDEDEIDFTPRFSINMDKIRLADHKSKLPFYTEDEMGMYTQSPDLCTDRADKIFIFEIWDALVDYFTCEEEDDNGNLHEVKGSPDGKSIRIEDMERMILRPAFEATNDAVANGRFECEKGSFPVSSKEPLAQDSIELITDFQKISTGNADYYKIDRRRFRDISAEEVEMEKTTGRRHPPEWYERNRAYLSNLVRTYHDEERAGDLTDIELSVGYFLDEFFELDLETGVITDIREEFKDGVNSGFINGDRLLRFSFDTAKDYGIDRDTLVGVTRTGRTDGHGNLILSVMMFSVQKMMNWNELHKQRSILLDGWEPSQQECEEEELDDEEDIRRSQERCDEWLRQHRNQE